MKMRKDNINELKQPAFTCKSICVKNKIWQVNWIQQHFSKSKMASKIGANYRLASHAPQSDVEPNLPSRSCLSYNRSCKSKQAASIH